MSTFNDLLHTIKEVCDEKDKRIEFLEGRIEGLNKQYSLIREKFLTEIMKPLEIILCYD